MLKVKNLTKKYLDNTVLENINLEFDRCELVFIMGESGSGKSTILNIMGLLDNDYTGEVIIHGEKVDCKDTLKAEVIRSNMLDIIFQEYNLIYYLSVEDNIRLSLGLKGELIDENRIDEVLSSLHIESLRHKKASELSGGEKQRVAIARALCRGNSIILADEPMGIEWGHGVYLSAKLSDIDLPALRAEYCEPDNQMQEAPVIRSGCKR